MGGPPVALPPARPNRPSRAKKATPAAVVVPPQTQEVPEEGDDLQAMYAEVARLPYRFRWADRWWSLPHIADLDYRTQVKIEQFGDDTTLEAVNDLFREIFGPEQADEWDKVTQPGPFLELLFGRWVKHSGRKPGEPSASTGSSPSTGRPSKRTSTGTTGSASTRRSTAKKASGTRRGNS